MGRKSAEQREREQIQLYTGYQNNYKKSNTLINAKGRSTLLGMKLFTIGIIHAKYDDDTNEIVSVVYSGQLKKMLGSTSGSLFTHIKEQIHPKSKKNPSLLDWRIIYEDDKAKKISASNVITDAEFADGVLKITFNTKLKDYIIGLNKNFTMLDYEEQFHLSSQYSYRLYEMCKQQIDYINYVEKRKGPIEWTCNLTELKLKLGIIDAREYPEIEELLKKENPDYDRIEEISKNSAKKYSAYSDFKKNALDKAAREVTEKTSLDVDYEENKAGRGGKVRGITFRVKYKEADVVEETQPKKISEEEMDNIIDDIYEACMGRLKVSECRAIAKESGYNKDKAIKACNLAMKNIDNISNLPGWIIAAIRGEYEDRKIIGKKTSGFSKFEQRSYDYNELEKMLTEN